MHALNRRQENKSLRKQKPFESSTNFIGVTPYPYFYSMKTKADTVQPPLALPHTSDGNNNSSANNGILAGHGLASAERCGVSGLVF